MTENFTYYNTVDQIYHAEWTAKKLARLEMVREWVHEFWPDGHPTRLIQVGGTSGKGSVCRYLEAGLALDGKTGAMTSPHIYDYRERYHIDGASASQADITAIWEERILPLCIRQALKGEFFVPSFHEIMIIMILSLFERREVKWGAIEVGIGGRYDQTSALDYTATVLTNVGRDHLRLLGQESWQRALDKAGVCHPQTPCFTSAQGDETLRILAAFADHANAPLHRVTADEVDTLRHELAALYPDGLPSDALLDADHQFWNAALSLGVIRHLLPGVEAPDVLARFAAVRFEGRFQQVDEGIYADVAHNPDKIAALVDETDARLPDSAKRLFIVALSGERSAADVFPAIMRVADAVFVTTSPRHGVPAEDVAQGLRSINERAIPVEIVLRPQDALQQAKALQQDGDVIILTGSTYMLDQALNPDPYLRYLNATHGWRDEIIPLK